MAEIVDASTLSKQVYRPYMYAWNVHFQGIIHAPYNIIHSLLFKARYYREIFTLADGEKIALDWYEEPYPKEDD